MAIKFNSKVAERRLVSPSLILPHHELSNPSQRVESQESTFCQELRERLICEDSHAGFGCDDRMVVPQLLHWTRPSGILRVRPEIGGPDQITVRLRSAALDTSMVQSAFSCIIQRCWCGRRETGLVLVPCV